MQNIYGDAFLRCDNYLLNEIGPFCSRIESNAVFIVKCLSFND